jgi:hypothetical protein
VQICATERLQLSHFTDADAAFILRLLNEPSFIRHISDNGVRRLDEDEIRQFAIKLGSHRMKTFALGFA